MKILLYKELYNAKVFILETLVLIPSINKIEITVFKPSLLNINPKPVIVT
jgi:hypothetical protein